MSFVLAQIMYKTALACLGNFYGNASDGEQHAVEQGHSKNDSVYTQCS